MINSPGTFITQKDEIFRLKHEERKFDVSPRKLESMVISNKAMITTQAIIMALENNIDIIFLDSYGDPLGRVWFSKMGSTVRIRRKQLEIADASQGLDLVVDMIRKKLQNQKNFLKKLMHTRPGKEKIFKNPIQTIEVMILNLETNGGSIEESRNSMMGIEGAASRAYFQCISKIMPKNYRFNGRSRRPAKDSFNAVLNYCYGILYSRIEKSLILAGLDPYIGFLHTDNYNKKSLVFDFIEPYRIFAEQVAVYLFTGNRMKKEYFDSKENSVSLNQKGKPIVLDAVSNHLEEKIRYRKRNIKRKYVPQHEAHKLANLLLSGCDEKSDDWLEIKEF